MDDTAGAADDGGVVGAAWFVAQRQIGQRWRSLAALTLLVGMVGGLSLSLIAGSRRSASVVDRYVAARRHYDFAVYEDKGANQGLPLLTQRMVRSIPGVARADSNTYMGMTAVGPDGRPRGGINALTVDWKAADPTVRVIHGEVPSSSDERGVMVNEDFVKEFGLSTGDTVRVRMFGLGQFSQVQGGVYEPDGPRYLFHITGVIRAPESISSDEVHKVGGSGYGDTNGMFVSYRFYETHSHEFLDFGPNFGIVAEHGTSGRQQLARALRALVPSDAVLRFGPAGSSIHRSSLSTPVDLETTALLALGISLAVIGAIATALVIRAEQRVLDDDAPTLRGLGCTGPQLALAGACRALPVAFGGAALAVGVAYALSDRYPVGIGRQLELQPGHDLNVAILAFGALAMIVALIGLAFVLGRPRRQRDTIPTGRPTFARLLARRGAPLDLTLGTHLAFERGRGVRSVPARAAIAGGAAAMAIVTAVAAYIGGVDHLYSQPAARGWEWDAIVGNTNFELSKATIRKAAHDDQIRAETGSRVGSVKLNGQTTDLLAFDPHGDAPPAIIAGRLPRTASEIALGTGTMTKLGVGIGSTVTMSVANSEFTRRKAQPIPIRARVVGKTLVPSIGGDSDFGYVGVATLGAIRAAGGLATPQLMMIKLRHGNTPASLAALDRTYQEEITSDTVPARVANLHRIRGLPLIGLILAALMGTMLLIYALAVAARSRAHELAILRAIGMPSRRLRRVLAWQGAVLATGIVIIGIPIGLVLGFAVWNTVAEGLGVAHTATVAPAIWLAIPLALLTGIAASLPPAHRARRQPVAMLLHVE